MRVANLHLFMSLILLRLVTRPSVEPGKFFDRRTGKAEFKIGIGAGHSQIE